MFISKKTISWLAWKIENKGFFKGDGERPLTRTEYGALCVICGITVYIVLIRLYQWVEYLNR